MRSFLLILVLLCMIKGSVSATSLNPDSLQATTTDTTLRQTTNSTLRQRQSSVSWAKKHQRLLFRSTATFAVAGLFLSFYERFDQPIHYLSQKYRTPMSDNTAKLIQPLGTAGPIHATFITMFTVGGLAKRPKMKEAAIVGLSSFYINALVTDQLKQTFQRHRPTGTNDSHWFEGADGDGSNTSLPSSHTSNAFAAATAIASVYHDSHWVPQVAYGMATLVGLSRINDNKHWASDVLAGAALGYITGKATYWGYKKVKNQLSRYSWFVSPTWQNGQAGVNASVRF